MSSAAVLKYGKSIGKAKQSNNIFLNKHIYFYMNVIDLAIIKRKICTLRL